MNGFDCPECHSKNVTVKPATDTDDDRTEVEVDDLWECHCNACGWDFLTVDLEDV